MRRAMSGVTGETTMSLALIKPGSLGIERARAAIAECREVDEAKDIRDKAIAVGVYLRTKGAARDACNDANEIALRAERRMGELLRDTIPHQGGRPAENARGERPLLADLGITKDESARAQKLAKLSEEEFAARVEHVREQQDKVTASAVLGGSVKKQSPGTQDRRTPRWLYNALNRQFGPFRCDAYATPANAMCERFITKAEDGNKVDWPDATFGNPEFDDMVLPLEQALRQAKRGTRSIILGPVGCSQEWYHQLAIQGTIYVPDCRINYDTPDGEPTDGADRDTIVMGFGREHYNADWKNGIWRVRRLEVAHLAPKKEPT